MLKPKIIIEVGTLFQKELIKKEFEDFLRVVDRFYGVWFDAVIIPENFELKIRDLTSNNTYSVVRGRVTVQAKFVQSKYGKTLVINPALYTELYDSQVRFHTYLHETGHFISSINKQNFSSLSQAEQFYIENISIFYDEYCSERFSWWVCEASFKQKTKRYLDFVSNTIQGHWDMLLETESRLLELEKALDDFRFHANGDRFLEEMSHITEPILVSLFYFIAIKKAAPEIVKYSLADAHSIFSQKPSLDIINLFHFSYPEHLEQKKALEKTKQFFNQFGFELILYPPGLLFVRILDV